MTSGHMSVVIIVYRAIEVLIVTIVIDALTVQ